MNKLKKIVTTALLVVTIIGLGGCGSDDSNVAENELRESLEDSRWEFWENTGSGMFLMALNFTDNWRDEDAVLGHDVSLTMAIMGEDPDFHFLYMRVYAEEEPISVTIFGHDVHDQEVKIFEEEPITIRGDVLHIGNDRFYQDGSDALEEHRMDVISGR